MKLPRRKFLYLAAGATALPAVSRMAWAQAYPARPVRIIVGFAAGGPNDIAARLIGQSLSERLGRPFVIENRPGAGSNTAAEAVVRAPPDGYTLFQASATNAFNATLYDNLNFDFVRDIAPVANLYRTTAVMEVNPSVPAKTVPEFIAYAKANPGKVNMATGGIGSVAQVYGELFKAMTGLNLVPVHYRGSAPALAVRCNNGAALSNAAGPFANLTRWPFLPSAMPERLVASHTPSTQNQTTPTIPIGTTYSVVLQIVRR